MTTASDWPALLQIAVDLTRSLGAADRYQRLLEAVRSVIPCDATALFALRGGDLVPLAVHGLAPQVLGMRFALSAHPRLAAIMRSDEPVRFPSSSALPDPFDGLVGGEPHALGDVHDCLGCRLVADGAVIGALTADAMATGAFDGLERGFLRALGALAGAALHTARLIETIEGLAEKRGLVVKELSRGAAADGAAPMLGVSRAMERVRREIETVAGSDLAVLILGETGVGKELAARALHAGSPRRDGPLIHVNCAALPESVVESELFGHVRGAFTGATANRPGKFEIADGGTLLLDEIGELPLAIQPKLLRALQEGEVQRVGADAPLHVDVRVVAATNRDLAREVAEGRFRADLYHRLNVYPLRIPPLRERRDDIGVLCGFFLDRYRAQLGLGPLILVPAATAALAASEWPGNIRELDHVLARGVLRAAARVPAGKPVPIEPADLDLAMATAPAASPAAPDPAARSASLRDSVDDFKRTIVERALAETSGSWAEAARRLGMHRSNLHHMARRLGVRTPG
ncbi:MAG TPA: nitric oxide reductase transcriptional regulator NorR [Candidatus Acidoferrum sp.]|nr:nitric oxide reductase transcriptional regulator NorR [Candidatus Acidoferrum sp.]